MSTKIKHLSVIILSSILLFHLINNIVYLHLDTRPPAWDQSWHKAISLSYYNRFSGEGESDLRKVSLILHGRSTKYPHLFHIATTPFYFLFGVSDDVSDMANMPYFVILILSVYSIGRELHSTKAGLFASFMVSSYPIIFGFSRLYLIDFSIVALVSISIYFLLKFKKERNFRYGVLLITSMVIGLFLKQIFVIFVALPFVFVLACVIFQLVKADGVKKSHLILGGFVCLVILPLLIYVYINNYSGLHVMRELTKYASFQKLKSNLPNILYNFINLQISFVYSLVFLFSLCSFKKVKEKTILLLWIIFPVLFLAYTNTLASGRYLMPLLPAVAVISSLGIFHLKNKKLRTFIVLFLIVFSLAQFFDISYAGKYREIHIKKISLYTNRMHIVDSSKKEDWQIENILDFIQEDSNNRQVIVGIASDLQRFNDFNFAYLTYKKGYYNLISAGFTVDPIKADYVVTKTRDNGRSSWRYDRVQRMVNTMNENPDKFELIKEYPLPDTSTAKVYRRKYADVEPFRRIRNPFLKE